MANSVLVGECISLFGVVVSAFISTVFATGKAKKEYNRVLELQKAVYSERVYIDSKKFDLELHMYKEINALCAEVYDGMCGCMRTGMRRFITNPKPIDISIIADRVARLELEINRCSPFVHGDLWDMYNKLLKVADSFVADMDSYLLTDEDVMGQEVKELREEKAYAQIAEYKRLWDLITRSIRKCLSRLDSAM